jgi:hypothetical protein
MLFAHPHASDGFQLQEMQLHDEKYDAIFDFQIHVHHVPLMCEVQCVTMGLGLLVHLEPRASWHLDAC